MKLKCIAIQTLVRSLEQGDVVKAITSETIDTGKNFHIFHKNR
jgi:hypothetical protein